MPSKKLLFLLFSLTLLSPLWGYYSIPIEDYDQIASLPAAKASLTGPNLFAKMKSLIQGSNFYGRWYTADKKIPRTFVRPEGFVVFGFTSDTWNDQGSETNNKFYVHIYDGQHTDNGNLHFSFPPDNSLPTTIANNGTWIYENQLVTISKNENNMETWSCIMNITVNFIDIRTSNPFDSMGSSNADYLGVQFFISSQDCGLNIATSTATLNDPIFESQFFPYMLAMYLFVFLGAIAYLNLYRKLRDEPLSILNISLGTLYSIATFDLYLFVTHVYSSTSMGTQVTRPLFQGIGIAFAAIVVFFNLPFLMEVKYRISRLQWKDVTEKINKMGQVGLAFNIIAFIFAFESVIGQQMLLFYSVFIIFPLPQIIQNFMINKRFRCSPWYMGALTIPKLIYIAYTEAYEYNLFRNTPKYKVCLVLSIIYAVQMLILLIQMRWPRFGIRVPKVYTIVKCQKDGKDNCPICLEDFKNYRINSSGLEESLLSTDGHLYMVITPCQHEFHLSCLQNWIKHKFDCPYCRRPLPLSQELDEDFETAVSITLL